MDANFWLDRWHSGQIGFHADEPHTMLAAWWDTLGLAAGARALVPLCGKSNDMPWLVAHGFEVVGVELSDIAVREFFADNALTATTDRAGDLIRHRAPGYTLYQGDFFALDRATLGTVDAVYDRAALIALPEPMRHAYAAHLATLAGPGTRALLITVDYDTSTISPPPFIVADDEVRALFGPAWRVERRADAIAEVKGQPATETVFTMTRRAD